MKRIIIAYIPVLHRGYEDFLEKHAPLTDTLYILGEDVVRAFQPRKEIRALKAETAQKLIASLNCFKDVRVLNRDEAASLMDGDVDVIAVNDDICRQFVAEYLAGKEVLFDTAFLRWDTESVFAVDEVEYDAISCTEIDLAMMALARDEALLSSDWWRRVGAVAVREGAVLLRAHNEHLPTEHAPYIHGDPRDVLRPGEKSELASVIHAEQLIVAKAAADANLSLEGANLYVTAFPCPLCAKLIAASGITRCCYETGSASLDGENILKSFGVEIVLVIE
jgi:dCMP deaminase